jgi:superfamily II DNA helicase RecQ
VLCFQLPAVVLGGTTIVIPLLTPHGGSSPGTASQGTAACISSSNGGVATWMSWKRLLRRSLRASQKKPLPKIT